MPAPAPAERSVEAAAATGAKVYHISAEQTAIRVLVRRAGRLANLGHNHVIVAEDVEGRVLRHDDLRLSSFEMTIPVASLSVDDPALRREEGEEFASEPSEADIAGTRRNMLGERVLDAARFPAIRLSGGLTNTGDPFTAEIVLELKGRKILLSVPITAELGETELTASGAFELTHAQLGLTPFSVMLGAIRVADRLNVKFRIVARAATVS
jgi:hypothetical protein